MIEINNLSKIIGQDYILKDVNFTINNTDKIGIVGVNGVGKSTLIKSILFDDYITEGSVNIRGSVGYVEQTKLLSDDKTLFEQYIELFPDLKKLHDYLQNDSKQDAEEYIKKEERYNKEGGYDFKIKVDKLLTGFGFLKSDIDREISSFSGGEKTKLSLIKLLLLEPDHLFLDEPTNHLDLSAIIWLEKYLKGLKNSLIIVSHDEVFLENVCEKIVLVENKKAKLYKTSYNNFLKQRELDYTNELNSYNNQMALKKTYEEFINKNRGKPNKIGQVNDRKSKLEKLGDLEKPVKFNNKINFEFEALHLKKSVYVDLFDVTLGYDNVPLIKNINFKVYAADKIAIIGRNGIGKSTFFKALLNKNQISGKIKIPSIIKIGYFDQEQQSIDPNKTLYELIYETNKFDSQSAIRKYLGKFLFVREDVFKKFSLLSGGEKIRITLALMSLEKYDILLLDEPTNHLDIETKSMLIDALKKFPATLIFITHDRKLIEEVATKILHFKEDGIEEFSNDWKEYAKSIKDSSSKKSDKSSSQNKEAQKDLRKKSNKKINWQKLEKIEEKIFEFEEELAKQKDLLLDPKLVKDYIKSKEVLDKIDELTAKLDELYKEYDAATI